jgi:hypothetical protein
MMRCRRRFFHPDLDPLVGVDLITEVLVLLERGGESGFLVRDLRILQDGRYTLPELSFPFVGRKIARRRGEAFAPFWGATTPSRLVV